MDESLLEVRLEDRFDHFDFQRFDEFSVLLDASDLSRGISFLPPLQRFGVVAADRAEALILTKARMRGRAPESLSSYECVLQVQHDCRQLTAARVQQARACLERAAESDPEYAVAWALLGMSYLGQVRLRTVPRAEDEIPARSRAASPQHAAEVAPTALLRNDRCCSCTPFEARSSKPRRPVSEQPSPHAPGADGTVGAR